MSIRKLSILFLRFAPVVKSPDTILFSSHSRERLIPGGLSLGALGGQAGPVPVSPALFIHETEIRVPGLATEALRACTDCP
jgi:hypothetical protein